MDYKEYYVGTGYAAGFGNFKQANEILNKYNDANLQENEFKKLRAPNGIAFSAGTTQGVFNIEAGFTQIQQRRKTKFNNADELYQRDVRLRINSYYISAGLFAATKGNFGIGANVSYDFYKLSLSTRENVERSINRSSFVSPSRGSSNGMTMELKLYFGDMDDHGTKLMIKPYYSILFKDLDVSATDDAVNGDGSSAGSDSIQNLNHFGVKFIITYSVRK